MAPSACVSTRWPRRWGSRLRSGSWDCARTYRACFVHWTRSAFRRSETREFPSPSCRPARWACPSSARRSGGSRRPCWTQVTGFVVPPGDRDLLARALNVLIADPELRRRLGEAGRRHITASFSASPHAGSHGTGVCHRPVPRDVARAAGLLRLARPVTRQLACAPVDGRTAGHPRAPPDSRAGRAPEPLGPVSARLSGCRPELGVDRQGTGCPNGPTGVSFSWTSACMETARDWRLLTRWARVRVM